MTYFFGLYCKTLKIQFSLLLLISNYLFGQTLIFPTNDSYTMDSLVVFKWNNFDNLPSRLLISEDENFQLVLIDTTLINTDTCQIQLNNCGTYYWKIGLHLMDTNYSYTPTSTISVYNPICFNGSLFWFDANEEINKDASNNIRSWGNLVDGDTLYQLNAIKQPKLIYNDFGSFASVRFDGSNDFMVMDKNMNIGTLLMLGDYNGATTFPGYRSLISSGNYTYLIFGNSATTNIELYNFSGTTLKMNNNVTKNYSPLETKKIISLSANPLNISNFYLSSANLGTSSFWNGDINELMGFSSKLNTQEIQILSNLLYDKYIPPVNLGEDIMVDYSFCPVNIHAGDDFISYLWNTGETTSSISVNSTGIYSVWATNAFGRITYDEVLVTFPELSLNRLDTTICENDSIGISIETDFLYLYNWNNGLTEDTIFINQTGEYFAVITDSLGCSASTDTLQLNIDNFASLVSLGSDTSLCKGNYIEIQYPSSNYHEYIVTWNNNLHDSVITVDTSGKYSVSILNQRGCKGNDTIMVTVVGEAPTIDFFVDSVSCFKDTLFFQNNTFINPSDTVTSWFWDLGDGNFETLRDFLYQYSTSGIYDISLTAIVQSGCSNIKTKQIEVLKLPEANYFFNNSCMNQSMLFRDNSLIFDSDSIVYWNWDFDDGFSSLMQNPSHDYDTSGNYDVTLEIETVSGCSDDTVQKIKVLNPNELPIYTEIIAPQNNQTVSNQKISFEWMTENGIYHTLYLSEDSTFETNTRVFEGISGNHITIQNTFPNSDSLFWKLQTFNLCDSFIFSETYKLLFFSPKQIEGLTFWLTTDSILLTNDSLIEMVFDLSGNGNHANQQNIDKRPILSEYSNINASGIRFDGINDNLLINDSIGFSSFYIIVNYNHSNAFPGYRCLISNDISQYNLYGNSGTTKILTNNLSGLTLYMNNLNTDDFSPLKNPKLLTAIIEPTVFFNLNIASNQSINSFWNGFLWEILAFDSVLNEEDDLRIRNYLYSKYAPPVFLGANKRFVYDLCADTLDASDRFVSYLWSNGDTNSFITVNKSGRYWVDVIDIFGFHSADTIEVEFAQLPNSDITVCYGDSTSAEVDLQGDYSFAWSNGFTGNSQYFKDEGSYWIRVEDTMGCFITDTFYLDVDSFALYASLGGDRAMCSGDPLYLVLGDSMATQYFWSNGDTSAITIIENPGQYTLMVIDTNGCIAMDTVEITIKGERPLAAFVSDTACVGSASHITDVSTISGATPITQWTWHFENGDSSQSQNPMYIFDGYGYHVLRLNISTSVGCTDDVTDTVVVYPYPVNSFMPLQGCSGIEISFSDGTITPMGFIDEWQWRFGDNGGSTSSLKNPKFTYADSGDYVLTLITLNEAGCSDTIIQNMYIKPSPLVDFSYNEVCFGEEIRFADQSVTQPYNTIYARQWSFGDGDSSVLPEPSHFYSTAGTYNVNYKVLSINGCNVDTSKPVTIHEIPLAEFIQQDACANVLFNLYDNSTILEPVVLNYKWFVDDSLFSMEKNTELSLSDSGMYLITLKIETNFGCGDSIAKSVNIFASPQSDFTYSPEYAEAPAAISFFNNSIGAYGYVWDFGDGSSWNYTVSPNHYFENNGVFTVALVAINEKGCSDTIVKNLVLQSTQADIAIEELYFEEKDGFLNIATDIINVGTQRVYALNLHLKGNNGSEWLETWHGLLEPGSSLNYQFVSKLNIANQDDLDIICVEAEILSNENGVVLEESNVQNNELCKALRNDFKLMDLYPNPANTVLNIDFILPYADEVSIEMYDLYGNLVYTINKSHTEEGYHQITYSLAGIEAATYTLRFVFRDTIEIQKFVKY